MITGGRVSGDAGNHTIRYSADGQWQTLRLVPTELADDGVYTFELPATYTGTDTAVCLITSSTEHVLIPAIELTFTDETAVTAAAVAQKVYTYETSGGSLSTAIAKFNQYPDGAAVLTVGMIPDIAQAVLVTDTASNTGAGAYSLTTLIMGSFCSTLDPVQQTWRIRSPSGPTLAVRTFTTSDQLRPIAEIQ